MVSFNLMNRWQSIATVALSARPRRRVRRHTLAKEPAMIEILEQRKVLSANVVMSAVSSVGHHTAQVVNTGVGTEEVYKDGVAIGAFQNVTQLQLSANGNHLAFTTHQLGHGVRVFLDGRAVAGGAEFASVSSLQFSPDGSHLSFAASRAGGSSANLSGSGLSTAGGLKTNTSYLVVDEQGGRQQLLVVIAIIAILIG